MSAVPPIVWSARRLIAANPSSSENNPPAAAAMSIAADIPSNGCDAVMFVLLRNRQDDSAPIIIIPSSAMFIVPLRSENIPPSATSISGTENMTVEASIPETS